MDTNYSIDISFICTYHLIDDYSNSINLYRIQLLQIFRLTNFCDKTINLEVDKLYNLLKNNSDIITILNKVYNLNSENIDMISIFSNEDTNRLCFQLLFGYDYLYCFHKCLINYINNQDINNNQLFCDLLNLLK